MDRLTGHSHESENLNEKLAAKYDHYYIHVGGRTGFMECACSPLCQRTRSVVLRLAEHESCVFVHEFDDLKKKDKTMNDNNGSGVRARVCVFLVAMTSLHAPPHRSRCGVYLCPVEGSRVQSINPRNFVSNKKKTREITLYFNVRFTTVICSKANILKRCRKEMSFKIFLKEKKTYSP